ncbi:Sec-independent protein translocase protein TatB (plasmid) [Photobacterium sp. DA100]|uniref:Sec-independent protein translocase protein TatB n=1 Tax=Photobacterium sp. DA100 TaxID=3027472 RepID=UPI00247975D5|nr:Sec-independent protein translocase protein TatB [Photobacterium sp. DA100]WEM45356.1 Sec-independent protein translocase protein TatB [Photobacterium sp. DA100]
MFDISFWELIQISLVGLIVVGPERLPIVIRTLSRWLDAVRKTALSLNNQLNQEPKLLEHQINSKYPNYMGGKKLISEHSDRMQDLKRTTSEVQLPCVGNKYEQHAATTDKK